MGAIRIGVSALLDAADRFDERGLVVGDTPCDCHGGVRVHDGARPGLDRRRSLINQRQVRRVASLVAATRLLVLV